MTFNLLLIFSLISHPSVHQTLNTKDIIEYNKWVKNNKENCPELKSFKIGIKWLVWTKKWEVCYYPGDGVICKVETLSVKPDSQIYFHVDSYRGILLCMKNIETNEGNPPTNYTIYNHNGEQLSSFIWGNLQFLSEGEGLFRSRYSHERWNCAELLTWDGEIIGRIDSVMELKGSIISTDRKYILILQHGSAILLQDGNELWRRNYVTTMSNDAQYIGHVFHGTIYVDNQQGERQYLLNLNPYPSDWTNPKILFSSDNKYLLAAKPKDLALIDNTVGNLLWKVNVDADRYLKDIFFTQDSKFIIVRYIGKVLVFDTHGNPISSLNHANKNVTIAGNFIIIDAQEDKFHRIIYEIHHQ